MRDHLHRRECRARCTCRPARPLRRPVPPLTPTPGSRSICVPLLGGLPTCRCRSALPLWKCREGAARVPETAPNHPRSLISCQHRQSAVLLARPANRNGRTTRHRYTEAAPKSTRSERSRASWNSGSRPTRPHHVSNTAAASLAYAPAPRGRQYYMVVAAQVLREPEGRAVCHGTEQPTRQLWPFSMAHGGRCETRRRPRSSAQRQVRWCRSPRSPLCCGAARHGTRGHEIAPVR